MDVIDLEKPQKPRSEIQEGLVVTEIIFFVIGALGLLFKILHWPGANVFLILGLCFFSFFLAIGGLFYRFWQIKFINLCMWSVCMGILFKILIWQHFQVMLHIGAVAGILVTIFFVLLYQKQKEFIKNNKFVSFRIISLTLLCWYLSVTNAQTYYKTFVNDDPIGANLYEKASESGTGEALKAYHEYRRSLNRPYSLDSADVNK